MRFFLVSVFTGLTLSACAELPPVDRDISRAMEVADPRGRLDLLRRQGEEIVGTRFVGGNKVELLRNGPATYAAMTTAINAARHRIDMESYVFDDVEGGRFADLLLTKRAQGLEVNLIYDAWGSFETQASLFDRLRQGGVHVVEYNPLSPAAPAGLELNHRDHRKLLMLDGAVAFVGGVNISKVYRNRPSQTDDPDKLPWRDTQIRVEGPIVAEFERLFMEAWHDQKGDPIPEPPPPPPQPRGDLLVQAIGGTPDRERPVIYRTLLVTIALARTSIHLTTGFFVPTPALAQALKHAAKRGVDVVLILPSHSDSTMSIQAGRAYYEDLLEAGIKIYERENVVLHAKTAIVDGVWSAVGSANLDWRSVLFNNELTAVILGSSFGNQMETMFREDIAASKKIDPATWSDRPFGERLDELSSRLLEYFL
jgi:cardiolipin synthase